MHWELDTKRVSVGMFAAFHSGGFWRKRKNTVAPSRSSSGSSKTLPHMNRGRRNFNQISSSDCYSYFVNRKCYTSTKWGIISLPVQESLRDLVLYPSPIIPLCHYVTQITSNSLLDLWNTFNRVLFPPSETASLPPSFLACLQTQKRHKKVSK